MKAAAKLRVNVQAGLPKNGTHCNCYHAPGMPGVCTPCTGVFHVHVDSPYFGQCFIILLFISCIVGPIISYLFISVYLLINLIKLTPLILRRSLVHFYPFRSSFPFLLLLFCFVFLFFCLFVCLFVFCWGLISLFNDWFWHLNMFFFFFFFFLFVCFFLNTYRYIGLYLSFKIFMRILLFKFILPLHTKPLWMDKWKYAWIVQRCQPSLFQREAPYFLKHFCPFWHPNLAASLFLTSFVTLMLHVILKTSFFFVWILPIFWMLMLASLIVPFFSHFNEKMFCYFCFFVAYCLPKT